MGVEEDRRWVSSLLEMDDVIIGLGRKIKKKTKVHVNRKYGQSPGATSCCVLESGWYVAWLHVCWMLPGFVTERYLKHWVHRVEMTPHLTLSKRNGAGKSPSWETLDWAPQVSTSVWKALGPHDLLPIAIRLSPSDERLGSQPMGEKFRPDLTFHFLTLPKNYLPECSMGLCTYHPQLNLEESPSHESSSTSSSHFMDSKTKQKLWYQRSNSIQGHFLMVWGV